ncbi:MAG TPA: hypothetical protein VGM14_20865 [Streptosporangiaceae bacterium]|jgi:hypothetical protein
MFSGPTASSLILHWTGGAWKRVTSPHLGGAKGRDTLDGVTAISGADLWAVGNGGGPTQNLAFHCC